MMNSTAASDSARRSWSSGLRAPTCRAQFFHETLQLHQVVETLFDRALQILTEQRSIDVLLVGLDHRVGLDRWPLQGHEKILPSAHKSGTISLVLGNNPKIPPVWTKT